MKIGFVPREPYPAISSILALDLTRTGNVNSFASEQTFITAPAGFAYQVLGMMLRCEPPPGAGSGTHSFNIAIGDGSRGGITGASVFGTRVRYNNYHWDTADSSQVPANTLDQGALLQNLWALGAIKVAITYQNLTDVLNDFDRDILVYVRRVQIA